jgi:outer membrane protein assembly factor BamD
MNETRHSLRVFALLGLLAGSLVLSSCGRKATAAKGDSGAEPDKVLYETAIDEIGHGRHEQGRLALQTLMNTYPDSEYLAKAKLGIADSYYREGGVSGLTQAVAEYEDFITFFPFLDEAVYAQMQVGMAHYRRMEKPDRDRTEALAAETAFQTLLQKYPDGPIAEEAKQRLREVQEVIAEGEMRIAQFYFIRNTDSADKSALRRLQRLISRYPLYSQADRAEWTLAQIYERHGGGAEFSVQYYANILKNYPLSPLASDAKEKLSKYRVAMPDPDPEALARMKKETETDRDRPGIFGRSLGMLKSGPDVSMAARAGNPTMTPASDDSEDTTILGMPAAPSTVGGGTGVTVEPVAPRQN